MSVMTIKEMIDLSERIGEGNLLDVFFDDAKALEKMELIRKLAKELESDAEKGKEVVLQKISEETFVNLARAAQKAALTALASSGNFDLIEPHITGALKGYTHTVVLSIIGALINDEVI